MATIVLGLDVCGVVDAVGSEVTNLGVGDLVLYHGKMFDGNGGFAEYSIHDAETAVNLSREFITNHELVVSFAGSPCAAWTAYKGLVDSLSINLSNHTDNSSSTIAIIGASGGVGSFLLQFARMANFKNIIAVCSGKHAEYVTSLGATDVIDYRTESLGNGLERVLSKLGTSLDFAIDCVGAETVKAAVDHMAYGGRILPLVSFADFGDIRCFMKSITIAQLALGGGHNGGLKARQRIKAIGEVVTELIVNKQLSVPVTSVVGLEGVGPALK